MRLLLSFFFICGSIWSGMAQTATLPKEITAQQLDLLLRKSEKGLQLVDVRTPKEYQDGHIATAANADWTKPAFKEMVQALDRTQPIYVICLSGGRSAAAVNYLRKEGYTQVVEVSDGMMGWRALNLPEKKAGNKDPGMKLDEFNQLLQGEQLILVDFYAEWCIPCRKMAPFLENIEKENSKTLRLVRVDTEAHSALSQAMKVQALPFLQLYRAGQKIWEHQGFLDEEALKKVIKEHRK